MRVQQVLEAASIQAAINGSVIRYPVYYGSTIAFKKFNRPPHGVFFTPHRDWAEEH